MATKYKRIKARIERDKIKRIERQNFKQNNLENTITFQNYLSALKKCNKNVSYKKSVQHFNMFAIENIHRIINDIRNGEPPVTKEVPKIIIMERGKERIITPIAFYDRITQRVICDNILTPYLSKSLIYDNGASMKGKGVSFARKRIMKHLQKAVKKCGNNFYVLSFDFKSFFDSIPHAQCKNILNNSIKDRDIKNLILKIIVSYAISDIEQSNKSSSEKENLINEIFKLNGRGICLGSQISQLMALSVPNQIDHLIKEKWKIKGYERYMDDGIIIHHDKGCLKRILKSIIECAKSLGLFLNLKKTKIVKVSKGFTFLKIRYFVTKTGKIVRKLTRGSIVRMRRKLKKFKKMVDNKKMTIEDVKASLQSWLAYSKSALSFRTKKNMICLYRNTFCY